MSVALTTRSFLALPLGLYLTCASAPAQNLEQVVKTHLAGADSVPVDQLFEVGNRLLAGRIVRLVAGSSAARDHGGAWIVTW